MPDLRKLTDHELRRLLHEKVVQGPHTRSGLEWRWIVGEVRHRGWDVDEVIDDMVETIEGRR